jgi:hypothetical protein
MSESTLTLCYVELMSDVAYFLYGKRQLEDLSTDQLRISDDCVQAGYRQFLYPPAAEGIPAGYEWGFLRPTSSLVTEEDDADQDLPADFGRLIGDGFTFEADAQVAPVLADIGEGKIRRLRLEHDETGRPRVAGLRRKASDGTTGQRWEVMWFPTPDDAYTLEFRYEAFVEALSETAPYPLGGVKHADAIRASCIFAADAKVNDSRDGSSRMDFFSRLASSIKRDRAESQKFFGDVTRSEDGAGWRNYTMTIGDEQVYP